MLSSVCYEHDLHILELLEILRQLRLLRSLFNFELNEFVMDIRITYAPGRPHTLLKSLAAQEE